MPFTFKLARRLARLKPLAFAGLTALASCEKPLPITGTDPATPAKIVVTPDSVALDPGQTQQFQAYGRTAAGDSVPATVDWSASLGTVTQSGLYTADTAATDAVVTATLRGGQLSGTAKVVKRRLLQMVLIPSGVTLPVGGAQQFNVYGRTNTGDSVAVPVNYAATGGTITPAGFYTAASAPGAFQVIANATRASLADTAAVTVSSVPVASVAVSPATANLFVGGTVQLTATARDSAGNPLTGRSITWASGNPSAATVSGSGLVTGVAAGTATVTATSEGKSAGATVTIAGSTGNCTGFNIPAGTGIQSAVNNNPAGTTFCLGPGTFVQQSVVPKSGDAFIGSGQGVTVLDGQNVTSQAFSMGNPPHPSKVTIKNLTVTRYNVYYDVTMGMINMSSGSDPTDYATGWVIDSVEASYSAAGSGIRVGFNTVVRNCYIHHNHLVGMTGVGDSVLIEQNEIAYNNYDDSYDPSGITSGAKFTRSNYLTVRNNYSHDNHGAGFWTDGWNYRVVYESNRVEDNYNEGIMHEISLDAVIRYNIVSRNGLKDFRWGYGAGILVTSSPNVEIYGNTVTDNARGIVGIGTIRAEDPNLFILQNFYVHDNTVRMTNVATDASGLGNSTGIVQNAGDLTYFTGKNNRFVHNTYYLGTAAQYFVWMNAMQTEQQWVSFGEDVTGTFIR